MSALAAGMDLAAHLDASIAVLAQLRADPVLPARIPAASTALVQQAHITLGHVLCGLIEDGLHPRA